MPETDRFQVVLQFEKPKFRSQFSRDNDVHGEDLNVTWPELTKGMENLVQTEVDELVKIYKKLSEKCSYTESEWKQEFNAVRSDKKTSGRAPRLFEDAQSLADSHSANEHDLIVTYAYVHVTPASQFNPSVTVKVFLKAQIPGQEESKIMQFTCWRPYKISHEMADAADHHSKRSGKDGFMFSKGDTETPQGSFSHGSGNPSEHTVPESNEVTFIGSADTLGV
jgi:hypothetical protein